MLDIVDISVLFISLEESVFLFAFFLNLLALLILSRFIYFFGYAYHYNDYVILVDNK